MKSNGTSRKKQKQSEQEKTRRESQFQLQLPDSPGKNTWASLSAIEEGEGPDEAAKLAASLPEDQVEEVESFMFDVADAFFALNILTDKMSSEIKSDEQPFIQKIQDIQKTAQELLGARKNTLGDAEETQETLRVMLKKLAQYIEHMQDGNRDWENFRFKIHATPGKRLEVDDAEAIIGWLSDAHADLFEDTAPRGVKKAKLNAIWKETYKEEDGQIPGTHVEHTRNVKVEEKSLSSGASSRTGV